MKKLTIISLTFFLFSCSTTSNTGLDVKDWETSATLFCGLQAEKELSAVSKIQAQNWINNNNIPKHCSLIQQCLEENLNCGTCLKETEHNLGIGDIRKLRTFSGDRSSEEYKAIKIEQSKKYGLLRILNFKTRYLLDFKNWEFYPTENNKMTLYNYSWTTQGMFRGDIIKHTVNREKLLLEEIDQPAHKAWRIYKTYSCKLIAEKELDDSIKGFKKFQFSYYEKRKKEDLDRKRKEREEREIKNKI